MEFEKYEKRTACTLWHELCCLEHGVKAKGVRIPHCKGCRPRDKKCSFLKKKCDLLLNNAVDFCYECKDFTNESLKHLDKRYRTFFHMSFIENLNFIKEHGVRKFLEIQREKWECTDCGKVICCHNGICFSCSLDQLKNKKNLYRWKD